MMNHNPALTARIKEQYPPGTRVRLTEMKDPYSPVPPGTLGTVDHVDSIGTLHMKWDNGRALGLIPGEDNFSVIGQALTPMKLYMPLHCDRYCHNEDGDLYDYSELLNGREARYYADSILAAMENYRMPEETERGLMHWYHKEDTVNKKVHSAVFSVEQHDGSLWGIVKAELKGELDAAETTTLLDYLTGQASDGWGEGFEQQDIDIGDGEILNVHLWNSDGGWRIMTEAEFAQRHEQEQAPQMGDMSY